jgi:hypothetical protein
MVDKTSYLLPDGAGGIIALLVQLQKSGEGVFVELGGSITVEPRRYLCKHIDNDIKLASESTGGSIIQEARRSEQSSEGLAQLR